ncbi:MAG: CRISPR-associated endonuclease Cas2 [Planctomycetes bacterium]|nr:CRISPR-associated endonuclease Cas2 [Planctomycetota bacterium]
MRARYLVAYDVSDAKRLRRMHRTMRGFGESLQFSVFLCDLSEHERVLLRSAVTEVMKMDEDRLLIVNLGPADGRGGECLEVMGRQHPPEEIGAVVV